MAWDDIFTGNNKASYYPAYGSAMRNVQTGPQTQQSQYFSSPTGQWLPAMTPRPANTYPTSNVNAGGGSNSNSAYNQAMYDYDREAYDQAQAAINASIYNLSNQMNNLTRSYGKALKGLGTTRDETIQGQRGYFNAISPEAYQSQQGVYQQKAEDVYNEGVEELKYQKRQNEIALAQAMSQANDQQKMLENQKNVFAAQAGEGGMGAPSYNVSPIRANFRNYDTSNYVNQLSQLYLANLLGGGGQPNYAAHQQKFDENGNPVDENGNPIEQYLY